MEPMVLYLDGTRWDPMELWGPKVEQCSRKLGGGRRPSKLDFQIPDRKSPQMGPLGDYGTQSDQSSPHVYPARGVSL